MGRTCKEKEKWIMNKNVTCPQCNGENLYFCVDLGIIAPMRYFWNVNKATLREIDFEVSSVDWSKASMRCPDCNWHYDPKEIGA